MSFWMLEAMPYTLKIDDTTLKNLFCACLSIEKALKIYLMN